MILIRLIRTKTLSSRAYLAEKNPERILKFAIGIAVAAFFITFGYWFFGYIFDYLKQLGDVGTLLIGKVLSLTFFAVMVLLFISNLLTSISTIYRNRETAHLFALPLAGGEIFTSKAIDSFIFSTWAFAVLGLPMIFAYGQAAGYSLYYYIPIVLLMFFPFVLIPAAASNIILLIYFRFARSLNPKKFALLVVAGLLAVLFTYLKLSTPENLSLYTYQDWRILNNYLSGMALSSSPYLPSSWVSASLQQIASANLKGAGIFILSLISSALIIWQITIFLAGHIFAPGWQNTFGAASAGAKRPIISGVLLAPLRSGLFPSSSSLKNMLYKDASIFFRDASQWGQLSILIGLMLVYLFNLRFFPANLTDPFWKSVIAFANFAFTGFVLATLAVRFVFPTISMEGKSFWALKSAPVKTSLIFWEKFALAFFFFAGLAEVLAYISCRMLGLPPLVSLINHLGVLLVSFSLTGLAVGMGAIFPNFEEQNPSRIASGAGGMLAAILSLVYVCIVVILAAYPTHLYTKYLSNGEQIDTEAAIFSFVAILVISFIAFIVPVLTGLKKLQQLEL